MKNFLGKKLQPINLDVVFFPAKLALPDMQRPPSEKFQISVNTAVTCTVGIDFGFPEICSGLGEPKEVAIVSMPETTVNKNHRAVTVKNKIRAPR